MFRLGVTNISDLRRQLSTNGRAAVDIALFLEVNSAVADDEEAQVLQSAVLSRMRFRNGTYKRTSPNRFDGFDQRLIKVANEAFPQGAIQILDVGVSDGSTSAALVRSFKKQAGRKVELLGIDRYMNVEIRRHKKRPIQFAFDACGDLVQVRCGNFVFNCHALESWIRFPVNRFLGNLLIPRWRRVFADGNGPDFNRNNVNLFGRLASSMKESGAMDLQEGDLFHPPPGPFQLVRAMNVLNPSYFPSESLAKAVIALRSSLVDDGLLAVGSNENAGSPVEGAIYRRTETGFERVEQADRPCRIDSIILDQFCKVGSD